MHRAARLRMLGGDRVQGFAAQQSDQTRYKQQIDWDVGGSRLSRRDGRGGNCSEIRGRLRGVGRPLPRRLEVLSFSLRCP